MVIRLKNIESVEGIEGTNSYRVTIRKGRVRQGITVGRVRGSILHTRFNNRKLSVFYKELKKDAKEYSNCDLNIAIPINSNIDKVETKYDLVRFCPKDILSQKYAGKESLIDETMLYAESRISSLFFGDRILTQIDNFLSKINLNTRFFGPPLDEDGCREIMVLPSDGIFPNTRTPERNNKISELLKN
ncbi:MAG: hypothetical protein NTV88_02840 [Candidatus Micrarchaeota archaeon]|nr:hypothetical protein [Candidatus Micrarchaeota archaeon]